MNKLQMAHDWAMKHGKSSSIGDRENTVKYAWQYADAMQAEADKRIDKSLPDVLQNNLLNKDLYEIKESIKNRTSAPYWSPDWSQAPEIANYWAIDGLGNAEWKYVDPKGKQLRKCAISWDVENSLAWEAPTFNYNGNWKNSLRKRPE